MPETGTESRSLREIAEEYRRLASNRRAGLSSDLLQAAEELEREAERVERLSGTRRRDVA